MLTTKAISVIPFFSFANFIFPLLFTTHKLYFYFILQLFCCFVKTINKLYAIFFLVMKMYMERLRLLRESNGKYQKDIAEILNMKQQQYQRYENGITEMSISLLNILADYYDTSIDYIIGRTDEKKPYPKSKK